MMLLEVLLLSGLVLLAAASDEPAVEIVERFVDRTNRHDVDGVLAMLGDGFEFRDAQRTFAIRGGDLRPMIEWDAAVDSRAEIDVLRAENGRVTVRLTEHNDFLDALGIDSLTHLVRYVVDGEGVVEIVLLEAGTVSKRTREALAPVLAWAEEDRPDQLRDLVRQGNPVYTGETAPAWLALVADARAAGVLDE